MPSRSSPQWLYGILGHTHIQLNIFGIQEYICVMSENYSRLHDRFFQDVFPVLAIVYADTSFIHLVI